MGTGIDKLASPSALSFLNAATPDSIPAAAMTAVAAISSAISFIYNSYKHYEEKKHAEEIAVIEGLHQEFLAKISIRESNIVTGFPPIFQKDGEGQCQAMTMTDAQVRSIANNALRAPTDIDLVTYRHHIICAIDALKKYYFLHDDKTGITVQVILYLLNVLEKLLQFEGYAFDIAYLNALCNFICNYASKRGEKSKHFTCLNPVFCHLGFATQKLIQHRETRSQEEMVAELRGTCMSYINQSIRALAKFTLPYTEWDHVNCCDPYQLRDGIYASEYITRAGAGLVTWTHSQLTLPTDCLLTHFVRTLTTYYLQTIDSTRRPRIPLQDNLIITKAPDAILQNIYGIFEAHPEKKPIVAAITQKIMKTLTQFAQLIHSLISFLYFLNELSKTIKNLGAAETDNPMHCRRMYALHEQLSDQIQKQAEIVEKSFEEIDRLNDHQMRIAEKECFLRKLIQMINGIKISVDNQSDAIRERRSKFNQKQTAAEREETMREHMVEVVNNVGFACNIALPELRSNITASAMSGSARRIIPRVTRQPTRFLPHPTATTHTAAVNIAQAPSSASTTPNEHTVAALPSAAAHNEHNNESETAHHTTSVTHLQIQPTTTHHAIVIPQAHLKIYNELYETAKKKSTHTNMQLLHLMLDAMNNYTRDDSRISRLFCGDLFHHQIDEASKLAKNLREKIAGIINQSNDAVRPLVLEQLGALSDGIKKPDVKADGTFATRIQFIIKKCGEKGIFLSPHVPTAVSAMQQAM